MATPSNQAEEIDIPRLTAALLVLSQAFVKGEQGRYGMRIPAEPYRDGDLVCGAAARLIGRLQARDSQAVTDVLEERFRQVQVEGYTSEHDDGHADGALAKAAACYALCAGIGIATAEGIESHYEFVREYRTAGVPSPVWPWDVTYWKPKDPRRDLVRAAALILAEIERLDRLNDKNATNTQE